MDFQEKLEAALAVEALRPRKISWDIFHRCLTWKEDTKFPLFYGGQNVFFLSESEPKLEYEFEFQLEKIVTDHQIFPWVKCVYYFHVVLDSCPYLILPSFWMNGSIIYQKRLNFLVCGF